MTPSKVHVKHGAYYYVHQGRWHWLSRVSDGEAAMYRALSRAMQPAAHTVKDLLDAYLTFGMWELKPATQKNYRARRDPLVRVFGEMAPEDVTPGDIAQYLERRKMAGKAVSGNREISLLSSAYNYGQRRGLCNINPCRGVRRNREQPRTRYVRDEEFREAFDRAPDYIQNLLALAYLTGLRGKDLRELKKSQVTPEGILIEESKTGKRRIIAWSEALRYFLVRAQTRSPDSEYVLTNCYGQQWKEWAIQSAMRRLKVSWTLHDLRAKAESDHESGIGLMSLYKRATRQTPVR